MVPSTPRPLLIVISRIPPERVGALQALGERTPIELVVFEGRDHHFSGSVAEDVGFPVHRIPPRQIFRLAAQRHRWRAVICGTAGRLALPSAWRGARRAGVPFVLWSALWHEPSTLAFLLARPLLRRIVHDADAIAVYGPHVAAHVRRLGGARVHVAPQAVDPSVWVHPPAVPRDPDAPFRALYVGRDVPGKGVPVLLEAWERSELHASIGAELTLLGPDPDAIRAHKALRATGDGGLPGVSTPGPASPAAVREALDRSDVLCVPSERTPAFLEPWGLVCNEAMHRGVPVLASDAVGAVAGGLVHDGRNGRVVPAGDPDALVRVLTELAEDPATTRSLGQQGRDDVAAYTFSAWADGMLNAVIDAEQRD